ncbi:MAG: Hsp20/alpha crystallin family protein [Geobacteraceae bacterium]|nr:Hsp20/alpha crystallin family protein [Geobacteraceae bacterium]
MADRSITNSGERQDQEVTEETRSGERYLRPAVDILETGDGLVIRADLPGVAKEQLDIGMDKGVLTIQAQAKRAARGPYVYREFELMNYFRQFQLPDVIDQSTAKAEFKNGVLTLTLSKAEAAKPRRIEVKVD